MLQIVRDVVKDTGKEEYLCPFVCTGLDQTKGSAAQNHTQKDKKLYTNEANRDLTFGHTVLMEAFHGNRE